MKLFFLGIGFLLIMVVTVIGLIAGLVTWGQKLGIKTTEPMFMAGMFFGVGLFVTIGVLAMVFLTTE